MIRSAAEVNAPTKKEFFFAATTPNLPPVFGHEVTTR
jgi:hypothetical protein